MTSYHLHVGEYLKNRTKAFASEVVRLCATLRNDDFAQVIRPQLLRSSTGTACNYRAVCRSRSDKEFVSRMAVAIEEVDEAEFWLEMLGTHIPAANTASQSLQAEAGELRAILVTSRMTVLDRLEREAQTDEAKPDQPSN